jgi:hypothetical protein
MCLYIGFYFVWCFENYLTKALYYIDSPLTNLGLFVSEHIKLNFMEKIKIEHHN